MVKVRDYLPGKSDKKLYMSIASTISGRLPSGLVENPIVALEISSYASTAASRWVNTVSPAINEYRQYKASHNDLAGYQAAFVRAALAMATKYANRNKVASEPVGCDVVDAELTRMADRAGVTVPADLPEYLHRVSGCTEATRQAPPA